MSSTNLQLSFQHPSIAEFYFGKTVAITGGTGFVGHCVIEKLLRSCPGVRKIFILLRKKRNRSHQERVANLVKLPIFDKLKECQPRFAEKIVPIYCNLEEDGLGLDSSSVEMIQNEVNIFIHSAATLRFDEHLKLACKINTLAVRSVIQLCRGIQNFEALVHVSTAYSYCNRMEIGEEIYQTGWDFDKLHDAMQWMTDDMITKLTPDILRERPNTYTLTKAFGEEVLAKEGEGLPICIVRPSIIGGSEHEPIPGWCSNFNGLTGMMIAVGKGLLHSIPTPPNTNVDIIPVDFVVNSIIAAGWKTGLTRMNTKLALDSPEAEENRSLSKIDTIARSLHCIPEADTEKIHKRRKTIPIYQVAIGQNNLNTKEWATIANKVFLTHPYDSVFPVPFVKVVENKHAHRFITFIYDYLPAYFIDTFMLFFQKKQMMLKYNQKISENIDVLLHFMTREWKWDDYSLNKLYSDMSNEDKKEFNIITDTINWKNYIGDYMRGSMKFIVKESKESLAEGRKKRKILQMLRYLVQGFSAMMIWRFLISRSEIAHNIWHLFLSFLYKFINFFQLSSALQKSNFLRS